MTKRNLRLVAAVLLALVACFAGVGCSQSSNQAESNQTESQAVADRSGQKIDASGISITDNYSNSVDGEHAVQASNETLSLKNVGINKTGDSSGDEADFYGENATILASDAATLDISDSVITSNGKHANGLFSYGSGTTVNASHCVINTTGNCSGGLMTTGGATMNASDITAETTGDSSAAIRSDRGGGTVKVTGGYFTTAGKGSPVVYSTADITVSEAYMRSDSSQGVVIEGKNSATLNNCQLIASNTSINSDASDTYQAVMIYQSMSGDASVGESSFEMNGGSLENANGDIFFINNTSCSIKLNNAAITNKDASGLFLRAEAAGWGSSGSNGGKVNLSATDQSILGNMLVDSISTLNCYLSGTSGFTGAINPTGQTGEVYVQLNDSATWTLTEDSYISGLTCEAGAINLNGHTLYISGVAYDGNASTAAAFETVSASSSSSKMDGGEKPDSNGGGGDKPSGEKPSSKP